VSVLDAGTGRVLRTVRVGRHPWALAVASVHGRVCVANAEDGTVSILDACSGRVLRTVPIGFSPTTMAVDEPMARVYVANKLADHESRPVAAGRSEWLLEWQRPVQLLPFGSHPSSGPIPGSVSVVSVAR
jgi:YVTN family beta-propeller protein